MTDDPFLQDPINNLDKSDVQSGVQGAVQALVHEVIPRLNKIIGRQKRLHERLVALEEKAIDGSARDSSDNPTVDKPPLDEALSGPLYEALTDAGIEGAHAVMEASDETLLEIEGIGPSRLETIREVYPSIE